MYGYQVTSGNVSFSAAIATVRALGCFVQQRRYYLPRNAGF